MPMRARFLGVVVCSALVTGAILFACSGDERPAFVDPDSGTLDGSAGSFPDALPDSNVLPESPPDPKTCAEAVELRSYVGCDYWPTITSNIVQPVFDFAVAVANNGTEPTQVTVTGNGVSKAVTVAPGTLEKVFLPWVLPLKGGEAEGLVESVLVKKGAYHLVSDRPVVVYQFNPIEFKATGGEPGKDWSTCKKSAGAPECYSYSNDASLLLPSTAMTGAYRVMGDYGFSQHPYNRLTGTFDTGKPLEPVAATGLTITATADGTRVEVKLGARATVRGTGSSADAGDPDAEAGVPDAGDPDAGPGTHELGVVPSVAGGGTITLVLDAGDVAQLVAGKGHSFDFSGSLVLADKPVQVVTSIPCQFHPLDTFACDHLEETVFPAETLGKRYVVTSPTGPQGYKVAHYVKVYGHEDGTRLTYRGTKPTACPNVINAGEVVECPEVFDDFEVSGDKAFGVGLFMLGGARVDPGGSAGGRPQGDPSQSFAVAVEQFRQKYVFLAPTDYKTSYVDIVAGPDTKISLDGTDVSVQLGPLADTIFAIARLPLPAVNDGVHTLVATRPVGIQVLGYGDNTSFQYPGGLNLLKINPTPK